MFGPDPIDLFDPSPYEPIAYYGHLAIGLVAVLSALVALGSRKGGRLHRKAGYVLLATAAIVCTTSVVMLAHVFIPPLFMAAFTAIYAFGGAWLALQSRSTATKLGEYGLTLFEIVGLIAFLSVAIPVAKEGAIPPFAPFVIALIPAILLAGDAHWYLKRVRQRDLRIARHINRMVWGFVVLVRAPLVELAAGGFPISQPVTIVGPILLGLGMLLYFQRNYGSMMRKR